MWNASPQLTTEKETKFDTDQRSLDDFETTFAGMLMFHELTHSEQVLKQQGSKQSSLLAHRDVNMN